MKRLTTLAAAAALIITTTPAHAEPGWRLKECRFQYHDGKAGWAVYETKATIRCAAARFDVSVSTALSVADRESGFQQYAWNPSTACGVFQHISRYFTARLQAVPNELGPFGWSCFNARSNVLAAIKLASSAGWGAWGR